MSFYAQGIMVSILLIEPRHVIKSQTNPYLGYTNSKYSANFIVQIYEKYAA